MAPRAVSCAREHDLGSGGNGGRDLAVPGGGIGADLAVAADAVAPGQGADMAGHVPPPDGGADVDGGETAGQQLVTSVDPGVQAVAVTINQGTAIGQGIANGATPFTLTNLRADAKNTESITSSSNPFNSAGTVPDTAAGFCDYSGATPTRIVYKTGDKFETPASHPLDPMVPMAPFYFPLVYRSNNTPAANAFGGKPPVIGLFDWRPKDIDEALVVAESDDNGMTWYFMQTVLELNPDYTNPNAGGYTASGGTTGCPAAITGTNAATNGDDGWGHAAILQLPGADAKTGQVLYMLDRDPAKVDVVPLHAIKLPLSSNKFPIWNTNSSDVGHNDIKSIASAVTNTASAVTPVVVQDTVGLLNPDGIMAVFPTAAGAPVGAPVTVLYVQKILDGDKSFPSNQQCGKAPFSAKSNHDVSNVRLATTNDGIHFTDEGVVTGLNDPTAVGFNRTRWVSPRGTLVDIHGDASVWGLYFAGGNCLDGDSDAFHFIGYAESTDKVHWTVYNDIDHPIASINTITTKNVDGSMVTVPSTAPVFATRPWFAQRLYAPSAVQIDPTHLSLTFAGYGVQSPNADLLNYRQIGNVILTVSRTLPAGTPNNINAH